MKRVLINDDNLEIKDIKIPLEVKEKDNFEELLTTA